MFASPAVLADQAFETSISGIGPAVDIAAYDTVRQVLDMRLPVA